MEGQALLIEIPEDKGPQNADQGTVEGIEDVIMERDQFIRGPYTSLEIQNVGRRITVRNASTSNGALVWSLLWDFEELLRFDFMARTFDDELGVRAF